MLLNLDGFIHVLSQDFGIKDLQGSLSYILGLQSLCLDGLLISQTKYALDLCLNVPNPWALLARLTSWLSNAFWVTSKVQLIMASFNCLLLPFVPLFDPDCADFLYARHSTTGYLIYFRNFRNKLISWCSRKQPKVFHSSVESECRVLANACTKTTWISYLFYESCEPVRFFLYSDNLSTTSMVSNPWKSRFGESSCSIYSLSWSVHNCSQNVFSFSAPSAAQDQISAHHLSPTLLWTLLLIRTRTNFDIMNNFS